MNKSIAILNIAHFRALLQSDLPEMKRATIERLLREEEEVLSAIERGAVAP